MVLLKINDIIMSFYINPQSYGKIRNFLSDNVFVRTSEDTCKIFSLSDNLLGKEVLTEYNVSNASCDCLSNRIEGKKCRHLVIFNILKRCPRPYIDSLFHSPDNKLIVDKINSYASQWNFDVVKQNKV